MSNFARMMKKNRTMATLALLVFLSLVLAACGGGGKQAADTKSPAPAAPAPATSSTPSAPSAAPSQTSGSGVTVRMSNYAYHPKEIRVKVGEPVTFVNEDHLAHDVVQTTPAEVLSGNYGFESPQVLPGSQWTTTFDKAGRYPILCTVEAHYLLGMTGEIIVEE